MINKVFHQIWINKINPELPDQFKRYRDTWLEHHPDWEYRLWNLENLDFLPECKDLLPQCQHPAQMADLLRIEILFRHGGVYIDTDFECLKSIDQIIPEVGDFGCSEDGRCISIGIIGAERGSPILREVINSFPNALGKLPVNIETGPSFFTSVVLTYGTNSGLLLLPSKYFYPFNYRSRNSENKDLSESYAIHHYADSWKEPPPLWRKILNRVRGR